MKEEHCACSAQNQHLAICLDLKVVSSPSLRLNWQCSEVYVQSSHQAKYIRIRMYVISPINGEILASQHPKNSNKGQFTMNNNDNKRYKEYNKRKEIEMDSYIHNMFIYYKQCGSELLLINNKYGYDNCPVIQTKYYILIMYKYSTKPLAECGPCLCTSHIQQLLIAIAFNKPDQ